MNDILIRVGERIHTFRKSRGLTTRELGMKIHKSQSTVSKYESGEIAVDIATLYEIADALNVHVSQLLIHTLPSENISSSAPCPQFFQGLFMFYSYLYDGRTNKLMRCVFETGENTDNNQTRILMYMNFADYNQYQDCENTFWGFMEHFDAVTNIALTNKDYPMETASVKISAPYLDAQEKWGLFSSLSTRPMMPISVKMLFTKTPVKETPAFISKLRVSKEDIRLLKLYNMFTVI